MQSADCTRADSRVPRSVRWTSAPPAHRHHLAQAPGWAGRPAISRRDRDGVDSPMPISKALCFTGSSAARSELHTRRTCATPGLAEIDWEGACFVACRLVDAKSAASIMLRESGSIACPLRRAGWLIDA